MDFSLQINSTMGAVHIAVSGLGTSMNDAFRRLQHESNEQNGIDAYSGGFNTIIEYHDLTAEWQASGQEAAAFLEDEERMDVLDKREANAVCLRAPTSQQEGEYLFVGWGAE